MIDPTRSKRPWTVLVVDDEPDVRTFLQAALERGIPGVRIVTAENGKIGLERLAQETVDLIVSDQRMPQMTGTEFLAHAAKMLPDIPRIVLTGFADVGIALRAVNEGHVSAFLQKPATADTLVATVVRLLQDRQAKADRYLDFAKRIDVARQTAAAAAHSRPVQGEKP